MRLLLDTHVVLWALADDDRLQPSTREQIADGATEVTVSAVSVWEITIKVALGKLEAPDDIVESLVAADFRPLDITAHHALAAGRLPRHHNDPFDRMLVAQAMYNGLTLVTADRRMAAYGVPLLAA
jgi:PIN domain nuclease of toxin-antitoxin system